MGICDGGIASSQEEMDAWLVNNKPNWGSGWGAGDVMFKDLDGDGIVLQVIIQLVIRETG